MTWFMKPFCSFVFLLFLAGACVAQASSTSQTALKSKSTLVVVPVFVKNRAGEPVFDLKPEDFLLTDNGASQLLTLEQDTDSEPLALAIVAQTGGAGARHLADYQGLASMLEALIGSVEVRVAVIGFDTTPRLVIPFTSKTDEAAAALATLSDGDQGAAILDAIVFAVEQLRAQPANYRSAILLLSETIDQGSQTNLNDALHLISDTNTAIYSFGFSTTRSAISQEASKLSSGQPGPAHGCLGRDGADPEYEGHYSKQVLDCISQLAPPLRLATMAFLTARNKLHTNTAQSLAELTGGKFISFRDAKDLKAGLIALSNDIASYYVLSFQPSNPNPGLHALHVSLKDRPGLRTEFRREYWIDETTK
jgi:VWFA-related protein